MKSNEEENALTDIKFASAWMDTAYFLMRQPATKSREMDPSVEEAN